MRRLFLYAFLISLLGSLPVGTLNVSVAGLTIHHGWIAPIEFSVTAILVETLLVRVAVMAAKKLDNLRRFHRVFAATTCVLLLLFAWTSLKAATGTQRFGASLPFADRNPWVSGFLLSTINPLHLPFWLGWSAVLRSKKILTDTAGAYNVFVIAIGLGTATAFLLYGVAGRILIGFFEQRQVVLNGIVGLAFLTTACIHAYKLIFLQKPDARLP